MTAREVPAITGGASEGVNRRNRRGGSAAGGWGRELNLRHCHSVSGWSAIGIVNIPFVLTLLTRIVHLYRW